MSRYLAAVLAAAMAVVIPAAPIPAQAAGSASVEVCVPALSGHGTICGNPVPQGAPWMLWRVRGVETGTPITVAGDCLWTSTKARNLWCYAVGLAPDGGWKPGEHTVTVTDTATGAALADATYQVTPQSPDEALEAFRGGNSTFARMGIVLALARLGQLDQALAAAQRLERDSDILAQYEGRVLSTNVLLALHRPQDALAAAQRVIAWRHEHGQDAQANDYLLVARAAVAACQIPVAEQALGKASLLVPSSKPVERLLVRVESLKESGSCGESK